MAEQRTIQMTIRSNRRKPLIEQEDFYEFSQIGQQKTSKSSSPRKKLKANLSVMKSGMKNAAISRQNRKFSWSVYKKLLSYTGKQWHLFVLSMITLLISSFITSLIPYYTGLLINKITIAAKQQTQIQSSQTQYIIMFAFIIANCVSIYIKQIFTKIFQERVCVHLRMDVFKSFVTNDIHFFELYKSGQLNSRVGNDINQAKSAISSNMTGLLRSFLTVIGNICILMWMSWKLALMIMILIPCYALVTSIHNRKTKMFIRQYQNVQAQASSHLNEIFMGVHIVKAFSTEQKEILRYQQIQTKGYSINILKSIFAAFYFAMTLFLPNIGILMVLWYGGNLVLTGRDDINFGQLSSFIIYCNTLSKQANQISSGYNNIVNGTTAIEKVFDMMNYEPFVDQKEKKTFQDYKLGGQIEFKNVNFKYPKGDVLVLKNLNLHINTGQYVAFVGQSGSGKSTIVKIIERFYEIQSGQLTFDGISCNKMNIKNIRQQISFVSQEAILFAGTIQENITYGIQEYTNKDVIQSCSQSGCMQFIQNPILFPLGLKTTVGEKGNQLSGGQRQRISIARALIRKPKILIFDQATSALDSNSQFLVQKSIQNLVSNKNNAMTIIAIAHRLSTIMAAHKIYVMKNGQIIQSGNHQQLRQKNGYYTQLISKQLQNPSIKQIED